MKRNLIVTVDVEAIPRRAASDPLDTLIWGRATGLGIDRMMSIAERHGVRLTMFLDFCEVHLYGDALLDVGREIHRRGHDLQIHLHPNFLNDEWYSRNNVSKITDLNQTPESAAQPLVDFAVDQHCLASGQRPVAFRGGSYRYNGYLLNALSQAGIKIDSTANPSRATQPSPIRPSAQFQWEDGPIEIPISTIDNFMGTGRICDYNFNSVPLTRYKEQENISRHHAFLTQFFDLHGEDAIAVLVMHSWSFLRLNEAGHYTATGDALASQFDSLLGSLAGKVNITTAQSIAGRPIAIKERVAFGASPNGQSNVASIPTDTAVSCAICKTSSQEFSSEKPRLCPKCGSLERQRTFVQIYDDFLHEEFDLRDKRILAVAPARSELMAYKQRGFSNVTSCDIRPEAKPQLVADISKLEGVADESFDCVIASYVLTCTADLDGCIAQIYRVLSAGGRFLFCDPMAMNAHTREITDLKQITSWYGLDAYEKYRVGDFRRLGDIGIIGLLSDRFVVKTFYGRDPVTGTKQVWFSAAKA